MVAPTKTKEAQHNVTFVEGGDGHMFGQQGSEPQVPGKTNQPSEKGPGAKYAAGGSSKMFGFSPSISQVAGRTSAR